MAVQSQLRNFRVSLTEYQLNLIRLIEPVIVTWMLDGRQNEMWCAYWDLAIDVVLHSLIISLLGHLTVAICGICVIMLGVGCGFGFSMWIRTDFVAFTGILMFLILGIGKAAIFTKILYTFLVQNTDLGFAHL